MLKHALLSIAFALTPIQKGRQVFGFNMLQKLLFVTSSKNFDFFFGLIINPHFNYCPNTGKKHGSIDNEHTTLS
jgi:hypothetical protein